MHRYGDRDRRAVFAMVMLLVTVWWLSDSARACAAPSYADVMTNKDPEPWMKATMACMPVRDEKPRAVLLPGSDAAKHLQSTLWYADATGHASNVLLLVGTLAAMGPLSTTLRRWIGRVVVVASIVVLVFAAQTRVAAESALEATDDSGNLSYLAAGYRLGVATAPFSLLPAVALTWLPMTMFYINNGRIPYGFYVFVGAALNVAVSYASASPAWLSRAWSDTPPAHAFSAPEVVSGSFVCSPDDKTQPSLAAEAQAHFILFVLLSQLAVLTAVCDIARRPIAATLLQLLVIVGGVTLAVVVRGPVSLVTDVTSMFCVVAGILAILVLRAGSLVLTR